MLKGAQKLEEGLVENSSILSTSTTETTEITTKRKKIMCIYTLYYALIVLFIVLGIFTIKWSFFDVLNVENDYFPIPPNETLKKTPKRVFFIDSRNMYY